jgi:hypothetical protein
MQLDISKWVWLISFDGNLPQGAVASGRVTQVGLEERRGCHVTLMAPTELKIASSPPSLPTSLFPHFPPHFPPHFLAYPPGRCWEFFAHDNLSQAIYLLKEC